MFCTNCGATVDDAARFCAACGASVGSVAADTKKCPFCAEMVQANAVKCRHCGEILDAGLRAARETKPRLWNPGVAALLSFVIPGAGQMYKGQVGNGIVWFLVVVLGYFLLILPGVILHIFCIVGAASGDPTRQG